MAIVRPFRALRPHPAHAAAVVCPPYDVISTAEARALAEGRPHSFLHVIRPEIGYAPGIDEHADEVYAAGARALEALRTSEHWVDDTEPAVYVYRLVMNGRAQVGVYACVAVRDYDAGRIVRHELTRVDKEDDRTRHILEQRAHAEPVMLTYRDVPAIDALVDAAMQTAPLVEVDGPHGVAHSLWRVAGGEALAQAFASVPSLYVADGHHRCKAASRTVEALGTSAPEEAKFFPAVLFPMSQMAILPYHRVVAELPDGPEAFLAALRERFAVTAGGPDAAPGHVSVYLHVAGQGAWFDVALPPATSDAVADGLDVARLQAHVFGPLLGIENPRTDARLHFVGGIRGTGELTMLVDSGRGAAAFSMAATTPEQLLDVSDAGELMPPKSTWFEPKLLSGLLVHRWG